MEHRILDFGFWILDFSRKSASLAVYLCLIFTISIFAQSGRVKPSESPTPSRQKPVDYPSAINDPITPKSTPTPQKVEKKNDDDVIEVNSVLIPIPASVLDLQGRAIGNLSLADFELQIDGKPAEISDISRSQSPVRLALLFDNSSSVIQAREFEKKAAVRFFKQVIRPEKDLAALYSVATVARLEQPLTKNVSQLVDAIENFAKPEGATSLLDGIIQAANYLKDYQGRRVIVIVSDGEDTLSDSSLEEAIKAIQIANCQVYVVKTTEFENLKRTGSRVGNANIRALTAERRMQEISAETGGAVYSPIDEDELESAFNRISAELSEQYILSYYPENTNERGKFQSISLNVKNKNGLTVRTRKGYYIPKKN
ncbi:MAG TPA: VWA domain-containing protein [Pyrinomonadaceae bacterium]|nr:VWA domain-containing protein [Pyrinomonadaceae bacterium]